MFHIAARRTVFVVSFACALAGPVHAGDETVSTTFVDAFEQHTALAATLENRLYQLIAASDQDERLELYRTYNQLIGTWLQIDRLQQLLDVAIAATSHADEDRTGSELRDQARFALSELDEARMQLERNVAMPSRTDALGLHRDVRSLIIGVRDTVDRLLIDHCSRAVCAP
jgi:hypothetical protein